MSALGLKQTFAHTIRMSALGHKRTHAPQQNKSLSDHAISADENRRWNRYTNRLSGL